jgi:hypothetical protein
MTTVEEDEVVGVVQYMGPESLAASPVAPEPKEAVHVAIGQQGADHLPLCCGNTEASDGDSLENKHDGPGSHSNCRSRAAFPPSGCN